MEVHSAKRTGANRRANHLGAGPGERRLCAGTGKNVFRKHRGPGTSGSPWSSRFDRLGVECVDVRAFIPSRDCVVKFVAARALNLPHDSALSRTHQVLPPSSFYYPVLPQPYIMSPFRQPPRASTSKETLDSQSPRRSDADQSDSLANSWNSISMQNSAGPGEAPWCPSLTNMDAIGIALDEGSLEGAIPLDYATQPFFGTEVPEFATPTAGSSRVGEAAVQVQHPGQIGLDWQSPSGPQFIDPRALHDDPSFFPTALSTSAGSSSRHSTPTPHPRTPTPPPTHPPPATSAPTPPQPARGRSGRVLQDVDRVNRPVAGPSRSRQIASRVQPKRAAKRPCEEHENLPATIPADGVTKRLRTKGPAVESAQASSSKATTSQPARKRRKQAELEALQVVPNTRCGLDGCDVRLPVDLAAARRHMWTHYGVPQPDVEAGSQPGGSTKGKQVMRSTDPKAKYVCKYRSVKGQCCTDDGGKPKALSGGQALERHVQGKHYGWKYVCEGCGSTFPRRDAPKRHEKTKHREHAREDGEPPSGDPDSDAESEPEPESDPE